MTAAAIVVPSWWRRGDRSTYLRRRLPDGGGLRAWSYDRLTRSEHHWLWLCCARLVILFPFSVIACDH
jgi:hypothetical protein